MKEKKEIKISLWTFYVLVSGIVMLIAGIIIASFALYQNANQQTSSNNEPNNNANSIFAILYKDGNLVFNTTGNISNGYDKTQVIMKTGNIINDKYVLTYVGEDDNLREAANTPWMPYYQQIITVTFEEEVKPVSTSNYFCYLKNLREIKNLHYLNTSNVTDMSRMFYMCSELATLDVSTFNTSNVTNMCQMFFYCNLLPKLDVSNFNTSNVTDMSMMFYGCENLRRLNLNNFNTSNVTTMYGMFHLCEDLEELNIDNFNTNNVTDMASMFSNCKNLFSINLTKFNTSNVTNMASMFSFCTTLLDINLASFDTSNVTDMNYMFYECGNLQSLDVTSFDVSQVTKMNHMFYACYNLEELDLSKFNTKQVKDMQSMFRECRSLHTIYAGELWSNTGNSSAMFDNCISLKGQIPYSPNNTNDYEQANYQAGYGYFIKK